MRADDVAVLVDDVAVFVHIADDVAVFVINGAVRADDADALAVFAESETSFAQLVLQSGQLSVAPRPQNRAVGVDDLPVFVDAPDHVAVQIDHRPVAHDNADHVAVFIADRFAFHHGTDDVAVHVNDRAVRQNAPDDVAVLVAHKAVVADDAQKLAVAPDRHADVLGLGNSRPRAPDHVAVSVDDRPVGQNATDHVAFEIDDRAVGQDASDQFAVFVVRQTFGRSGASDDFAVRVDDRSVRQHFADDVAVQVNDRPVGQNASDHVAVRVVHQTFRARFRQEIPLVVDNAVFQQSPADDVAVHVDDRAVGQHSADDVAVFVVDQTFHRFADTSDDLAAVFDDRAVRAVAQRLAVRSQNRISVRVHDRAVDADVPDNLAVRSDDRLTDGQDFADEIAVFINDPAAQIRGADHFAVRVDDRSVGQDDAQNFAVRADDLPQTDKDFTDDPVVLVDDFARRHSQPSHRPAERIDRRSVGQQTPDLFACFNVEHDGFRRNDATRDSVAFPDQTADQDGTDEIRSLDVHGFGYRIAAGVDFLFGVRRDALRQSRAQKLVRRIDKQGIGTHAADFFAFRVVQRSVARRRAQIGVFGADRARAESDASGESPLFVRQRIVHSDIRRAFEILVDDATVDQNASDGFARRPQRVAFVRRNARDNLSAHIGDGAVGHRFADRRSLLRDGVTVRHHPADRATVAVKHAADGQSDAQRFFFRPQQHVVGIQTADETPVFVVNAAVHVRQSGDAPVGRQRDYGIGHAPQNDFLLVQNFAVRAQTADVFALCRHHVAVQIDKAQRHAVRSDADVRTRQSARDGTVRVQKRPVGQNAPFQFAVAHDAAVGHDVTRHAALILNDHAFRSDGGNDFLGVVDDRSVGRQTPQRVALERNGLSLFVDLADDFARPVQQDTFLDVAAQRIARHVDHGHGRRQTPDLSVRQHDGAVRADVPQKLAPRTDRQAFLDHAPDDGAVLVRDVAVRQNAPDDVAVPVDDGGVGHDDAQRFAVGVDHGARGGDRPDDVAVLVDDRSVGIDIADDIAVFVDDRSVRHDAPDDVAVFVKRQPAANRRADDVAVQIDDRSVGQSVADQLSVFVDDASVGQNRAEDFPVRTDRQPRAFRHADDVALIVDDRSVGAQRADAFSVQPVHDAVFIGVSDRFAVGSQNDAPLLTQLIQHGTAAARRFVADAAQAGVDRHRGNGDDDLAPDAAERFVRPANGQVGLNGARRFGFPAHDDVACHVARQGDALAAFVFQNESLFLIVFEFDGRDADLARRRGQGQRAFRLCSQNDLIETQGFGGNDQPHRGRRRFVVAQIEHVGIAADDVGRTFGGPFDRDLGVLFLFLPSAQQDDDARQERQQRDDPHNQQSSV